MISKKTFTNKIVNVYINVFTILFKNLYIHAHTHVYAQSFSFTFIRLSVLQMFYLLNRYIKQWRENQGERREVERGEKEKERGERGEHSRRKIDSVALRQSAYCWYVFVYELMPDWTIGIDREMREF